MLKGRREGWIEVAVIVGGNAVSPESPLVRAAELRELPALRRRLLKRAGAKRECVELVDGDILVDFHKDEPGEDGGVEMYALDPVAFSAADALEVLPAVLGLPRERLAEHISHYMPEALSPNSAGGAII